MVCFGHFDLASELQKMVRKWCVLHILSYKYARATTAKSGPRLVCFVHFDLKRRFPTAARNFSFLLWLRARRFSEPTFRPSRPTNQWKNTAIRGFPNISCVCIFFLLTFAHLWFFLSDSIFLLCFSSLQLSEI